MLTDNKYQYVDPSDPRTVRKKGEGSAEYDSRMQGLDAYYRNRMKKTRGPIPDSKPQPQAPKPKAERRGKGLYDYIADALAGATK